MTHKSLINLLVAGVLFSGLIFLYVHENEVKKTTTEVFVATQDIPAGVYLQPGMVTQGRIPVSQADSDDIFALHEVDGLRTIVPISKNKTLLYTQFEPTEKNQSSILGHAPQNYTLSVDEINQTGKLYKPGTFFYFSGTVNGNPLDTPVAIFPIVQLVYPSIPPEKGDIQKSIKARLFTMTLAQTEILKSLNGKPLELILRGALDGEVAQIFPLRNSKNFKN